MSTKFIKSLMVMVLLVLAASQLQACGQKGPLYLPQPNKPSTPTP